MNIKIDDPLDQQLIDYGLDLNWLDSAWYDENLSLSKNISRRANDLKRPKNELEIFELCHYCDILNNVTVLMKRKLGLKAHFRPISEYAKRNIAHA